MRQIYTAVRMMFFAIALSAIGSVISNVDDLSSLGSLMSLAGGVMTIVAIYLLRHENRHFSKALRIFWIYFGLTIVLVIAAAGTLVSAVSASSPTAWNTSMFLLVVLLIGAVAVLVLALVTQYQLYAGFEELREVRQLDYPPKRIMWCFYLALISMLASIVSVAGITALLISTAAGGDAAVAAALATITMAGNILLVIGVVLEAVHLWLIFTYMQATKAALDSETPVSWS